MNVHDSVHPILDFESENHFTFSCWLHLQERLSAFRVLRNYVHRFALLEHKNGFSDKPWTLLVIDCHTFCTSSKVGS